MIVTLTPNPSVDRAITLTSLERGEVNRAVAVQVDAGGKGVNVARAITAQGGDAVAVLPVGGPEGHLLEELLTAAGVAHRSVPITGPARMNISVLEPDGTTTKLNEPGPELAPLEVDALLDATTASARGAAWVVGCGSLPPGAPDSLYSDLIAHARARDARVAIDSSGAPLAAAVDARPDLIKPNHEELCELVGRPLRTLGDVQVAAGDLVAVGVRTVVVSLGGDGALLVDANHAIHARASIPAPVSTVGAGDCMLAGLLHGLTRGLPPADALAEGVLWGSAAVTLPGSRVPSPADLRGITVQLSHTPPAGLTLGQR
ncbi:1-phosphofructokinase [Demequina gelatinilytica]|uniref:1-phosphofructokinase n=1 Tax=Demequina gelatinilytica TaxID=1638980 RepID=UPI000782D2BB|nr:1-phosphofructokinase [Demequina gelatinilytica]